MTPFDVEGREVGVPWFMMDIWYGTSLIYMKWYIVGFCGMVHRWFLWCGTLLVSEQAITISIFMVIVFS